LFRLNIHSIVDVITNSSTVIYTYQDSKVEATELLQEILNLIGDDSKVEDLFFIGTFCDADVYTEKISRDKYNMPEDYPSGYKEQYKYIDNIIERILKGEIEKPKWMEDAETNEDYDCFNPNTNLIIIPKNEKYNTLAKKMINFLNSTENEACYDS
jgi:hypothetical protein